MTSIEPNMLRELVFDYDIPFYYPPSDLGSDDISIMYNTSRSIRPTLMIAKVSTENIASSALSIPDLIKVKIIMTNWDETSTCQEEIVMPMHWTPCMFLGLLQVSVQRYQLLSIQRVELHGNEYTTINDLHLYFAFQDPQELDDFLLKNSSYYMST